MGMKRAEALPSVVQRRLDGQGAAGAAWRAGLDDLVADLERAWRVIIGAPMTGGTAAFVAPARLADGGEAIVKLSVPGENRGAAEVLIAANGRGYANVLAHDRARDALLMEKLGAPLSSRGLPGPEERAIICDVLAQAWMPLPAGVTFMTGAEKATSLVVYPREWPAKVGVSVSPELMALVERCAEARAAAFDPAASIVAHGDCHTNNLLAAPGGGYKFVDPEGMFIERAYDLGLQMREWPEELLDAPTVNGRARAEVLAKRGDVDPQAVWEWGVLERTSTGLVLIEIGYGDIGRECLAIAEAWARGA